MTSAQEYLLIDRTGRIATVSIDRQEKRNALSLEMGKRLGVILHDLAADPSISVIVLRGAGRRVFCAGADIGEMGTGVTPPRGSVIEAASDAIGKCPKPVIAMVFGYAMGGGCALAAACDLRLLSRSAKMGIPAAKLGIVYTVDAATRLVDIVGPSKASQMLFTGKAFNADECLAMGLADAVYPDDELEAQTYALATEIAENAPLSIAGAKRMIRAYLADPSLECAPDVFDLHANALRSLDHQEGKAAFREKRKPIFRGC